MGVSDLYDVHLQRIDFEIRSKWGLMNHAVINRTSDLNDIIGENNELMMLFIQLRLFNSTETRSCDYISAAFARSSWFLFTFPGQM